jgi:hypothetical protein
MKTYTTLFAIDVPHYGCHDIEAEDDQAAIAAAEALHKADGVTYYDPSWEYATCARIVHIEDPDGKIIVNDKALDNHFLRSGGEADKLLCDHAANLLYALKQIAETPLWGEPIEDEEIKNTLAQTGEYDLEDDEYTPSGDTEHDQLRDVVETARVVMATLTSLGYEGEQS